MQLIADRFIAQSHTPQGAAFDLATNRSIWLQVRPRGDEGVYGRWLERCDQTFRLQRDATDALIDYGLVGAVERFEAWSNAEAARCGSGAGAITDGGTSIADRPAITAFAELFRSGDPRRCAAAALWAPQATELPLAVLVLARLARLHGFVPIAAQALGKYLALAHDRTLCILDDGSALMPHVRAVLEGPRAHVCVAAGIEERPGLQSLALGSRGPDQYADEVRRRVRARPRVAEQPASYVAEPDRPGLFPAATEVLGRTVPTPGVPVGDLIALRQRVAQSSALLTAGRHAPGIRLLRQALGGLSRREAWTDATRSALLLTEELMRRGRSRDALKILNEAARYAERAGDPGSLLTIAQLTGDCWVDTVRLDEAERVLTTALTNARSRDDRAHEAALSTSLARCLFWRGEYGAAAEHLERPALDLPSALLVRRLRMTARVAVARGDSTGALAALDVARIQAADAPDDQADVDGTAAFVKLVIGDYDSVEQHVARSAAAARLARRPMRLLSARLLQAETDRRRSRRLVSAVARDLDRLSATATPLLRTRWQLLASLECGTDVHTATARQMVVSGLKALELYAGTTRTTGPAGFDPIVGDVVAILQVCQQAEDEGALLRGVCARVRQRLRAAAVALMVPAQHGHSTIAADGARIESEIAARTFALGATVAPARIRERVESGALVEYGGQAIAALCARWTIGTTEDLSRAAAVLAMAGVAASPLVAAFLARQPPTGVTPASELLGVTPRITGMRREIERAAAAPYAVLIQGESGSGKELVARAIHRTGPRRDRAFTTLNCAALPDDLVEAELFGHARGAFTGAVAERAGVFEDAHGGTLFLDEVGELSARAQAKVLRVIQEGELRRVGENVSRRVDVRIVAATNRDLRADVDAGRFRLDLLYRLDVVRIAVPPLRERPEDIGLLIDHYWADATRRLGSRATLAASTRSALTQYGWPGNVRELQNVLAALAVRSPTRGVVPLTALPTHLAASVDPDAWRLESARRTFEEAFVRAALVRTGGHRGRAAEELGVSRQGLTKLMARLGIP